MYHLCCVAHAVWCIACSNTGLSGALKSITAFEAHKDLDAMQRSTTFKVFLALFLNTGEDGGSGVAAAPQPVLPVVECAPLFATMLLPTPAACLVLLINAAMPAAISHITLHGVKIFDGKFSAMDVSNLMLCLLATV